MANAQRKAPSARPFPPISTRAVQPPPSPSPLDAPPSFATPHVRPTWHSLAGRKTGKGPALVNRFGEIVRAARLYRGLTQEDLAFAARLHRAHISLIETGRRDIRVSTICALAIGLKMNPADLMPVLFRPEPPVAPKPTIPPHM